MNVLIYLLNKPLYSNPGDRQYHDDPTKSPLLKISKDKETTVFKLQEI